MLADVRRFPLEITELLSDSVFAEAGRLKATRCISLADAIALAEAKTRRARLVRSDHHEFDAVEASEDIEFFWIR